MREATTRVLLALVWLLLTVGSAGAGTPPTTHQTRVFELRELDATRAAALHRKLLGPHPGTRVVPDERGGRLVVHDTAERLGWFAALVAALDVPDPQGARIYARPTVYRTPTELAELAREVLGAAGREVLLVPDDRSAILLVRTGRETYAQLDGLLRRLDRPLGQDQRRAIRVTPAPEGAPPGSPLPGLERAGGRP